MEPETLLAYLVIGGTATALVYIGSFIALKKIKDLKDARKKTDSDSDSSSEEESEALTAEEAYMFPIYGSGALLSLYLVFKFLNKEYVNYLVSSYFAMAETLAGTKLFSMIAKKCCVEKPNT
ncbi:hypothetical protein DSO57_1012571 [Entomophthora muscae]|uniref:Uncharacterized protein n=1 Tax=Entomophthora muscae TaxID=34485 RepID=A0ACC2UF87_9FUNG|nr:hypothetical protein DSO57_1012571 [Entomophthora muscae]